MRVNRIAAACLAGFTTLFITATAALAQLFIVNVSQLNVRRGPGTNFGITYVLRQGDRVEVVRRQGEWAFIIGERGGEGWVYSRFLSSGSPAPNPPSDNNFTNDVFKGRGRIDNSRYKGPGNANLVLVRRTRGASLSLGNAGRFSIEYLGTVQSNFEGTIQLDINQFRSSEMGYRTVPVSGTCDIQTSGGTVRKTYCTISGSGVDHGRSNFSAQ